MLRRYSGGSLQRQLPDEILSMIFTAALHLCYDPLSAICVPLALSHVCARWRKISISTSSLWNQLVLFYPAVDSVQIERTMTWLTRSKLQPLEILLDFRVPDWWEHDELEENDHPFTVEMLEIVLKILLRHVGQWKTFEMLTDTWEPMHAFLCHINTGNVGGAVKAPLLQSVALSRCNAYFVTKGASFQPADLKEPVVLFGGDSAELECLRDVSLTGVHVDWTRSCLRNLHDLSLRFHSADVMPSLPEFESMLSACPELEGLTVLGWGPVLHDDSDALHKAKTGSGPRESKPVLHLPSLKSLSYGFVDANYAIQFMGLLSMPSLHSLELQDLAASMSLNLDAPLDSTPLIEWLIVCHQCHSLSGPSHHIPLGQIERLELEGLRSSKETFTRFLRAFASLKKICLSNADKNLMSALHPGKRDRDDLLPGPVVIEGRERRRSSFASTSLTPLCPQLADMVCRRVDYKSLSEIVSARCQEGSGVQPLQTLEIDSSGDEFEDEGSSHTLTNEDHELLVQSGVDLVVHGRGQSLIERDCFD